MSAISTGRTLTQIKFHSFGSLKNETASALKGNKDIGGYRRDTRLVKIECQKLGAEALNEFRHNEPMR